MILQFNDTDKSVVTPSRRFLVSVKSDTYITLRDDQLRRHEADVTWIDAQGFSRNGCLEKRQAVPQPVVTSKHAEGCHDGTNTAGR
jgi:hypothetical protein